MRHTLPRRCAVPLLIALAAAWPALAHAARLTEMAGPPIGTTIDGFTQVMGPSAEEPEHAGDFVQGGVPSCPPCQASGRPPARNAAPPPPH